jgi:hypothetical protein
MTGPERIWACYDPEYDAFYWAGPNRPYPVGDLVGEFVSADLFTAALARADRAEALLKEAVEALDQFQMHYPHGINPWLDEAVSKARATLANIKEAQTNG